MLLESVLMVMVMVTRLLVVIQLLCSLRTVVTVHLQLTAALCLLVRLLGGV